jgi:hypothetical protein
MTKSFCGSKLLNRPMRRFFPPRLLARWSDFSAPADTQPTDGMKFTAMPFTALFFGVWVRLLADHICRLSCNAAGEYANTQ